MQALSARKAAELELRDRASEIVVLQKEGEDLKAEVQRLSLSRDGSDDIEALHQVRV